MTDTARPMERESRHGPTRERQTIPQFQTYESMRGIPPTLLGDTPHPMKGNAMGERGMIAMRQETYPGGTNTPVGKDMPAVGFVYLYTHWNGDQLEEIRRQIHRNPAYNSRQGDETYQARIVADILSHYSGGAGAETGMGISLYPFDVNYPVLLLDGDKYAYVETLEEFTVAELSAMITTPMSIPTDEFPFDGEDD